ncbi:MAG: hypothetical protein M1834_002621 [Cirrosporium novae-zelandiae]|nr:MAG: hypothetical protein M1834_002621 [Cirrosporium novae-zelandiae]
MSDSSCRTDENRGPTIIIINASITGVAALVVALRTFSRALILKQMGMDDWTIIAGTIIAILNVMVAGLGVQYGTGKHVCALHKSDVIPSYKLRWVTHIVYPVISCLIKFSTLFLYLRLFKGMRKLILSTFAFIGTMTLAFVLATVFQCNPIGAVYDTTKYSNYTCFNALSFWYTTAALTLVTDIWVVVMPIPTLLSLKIPRRNKAVLIILLSLGAFACIASIIRMVYIVNLYTGDDASWNTYGVSIWSGIELAVGIITTSIPGIKPLFDYVFPRVFRSTRSGSLRPSKSMPYGTYGTGRSRNASSSIPLGSYMGRDDENDRRHHGSDEDGDSTKAITREIVVEVTSETRNGEPTSSNI